MNKKEIVTQVSKELEDILLPFNIVIEDIEFKNEGGRWLLQVTIDKPGGVFLSDCENVNRQLGDRLDIIDIIPENYNLEVSSPGLERRLKKAADYNRFAGSWVKVRCFAPIDGQKRFAGKLLGLVNNIIEVEKEDGKIVKIPLDSIAQANIWFRPEIEEGGKRNH